MQAVTRFSSAFLLGLGLSLVLACPGPAPGDDDDATGDDDDATGDDDDATGDDDDATGDDDDATGDDDDATVRSVTVGAYLLEEGEYVDQDADLTYEVGANCQIWSRLAYHPDRPAPGHPVEEHDHWNAADESTYADERFTWIEYGPYLTESEVAVDCAARVGGSDPKTVTHDYTLLQNDLYLRIKSVD